MLFRSIDEMIQDYEEDLKNGIDIDPIIFLVDDRGVIQTARAFPVFDSKGNMIRGEIDYYGDD